jgi:hypothetical protein
MNHLYDVQGSYFHAVPDHGKGGYRANLRLFVLTNSAANAIKLWSVEAARREGRPLTGIDADVSQVVRRMTGSDVIIDHAVRS